MREEQAIRWLARLRADDVTAEQQAEFAVWLHQDAANKHAFDEITQLWADLGVLSELPQDTASPALEQAAIQQRDTQGASDTVPSQTRWWSGLAAAATVAAVTFGALYIRSMPETYATDLGQDQRVRASRWLTRSPEHGNADLGRADG